MRFFRLGACLVAGVESPFLERVAPLRHRVDEALARYLLPQPGCPAMLAEAMRYALLGSGKRLRPLLALLAAECCGGSIEQALPAACAVEMVHAYSLVHDDLPALDDDDLRRGQPTCHRKFGEAMAILAGDALLALAFEVLAAEVAPPAVAAACCRTLAEAAGRCHMVGGQADDLAGTTGPSVDQLEFLHHRKTGALIAASVRIGGLVAGANDAQLAALESYGRCLGLAFQIVDDLLDVCGDEAAVGKRLGKDPDRGKRTFPALLGTEQSMRRAEQLVGEARQALAVFASGADLLEHLARFVVERRR